MKLFTTEQINNYECVYGEVIGSYLATEFNLPVPKAALIETDENFLMTINDAQAAEAFNAKDNRIKFGCQALDGYNLMRAEAFNASQVRRMIRIGSLFAFDILIRNRDRNNLKPNLLVRRSRAVLIDHELGFQITEDCIKDIINMRLNPNFYQYHLVYNYLRRSKKETKMHCFDEFEEYLKYLNLNKLDSYFNQLVSHGYSKDKPLLINEYLRQVKQYSANFRTLLKGAIG